MATAYQPQRLSFDAFVELYAPLPERYELVDGIPVMMAGSNNRHALIASRIIISFGRQLAGKGCVPVGSDAVLKLDDANARLPDVGIYCDPRDLEATGDVTGFRFPRVLFEILSPSTKREDRGVKVPQYQQVDTLRAIVLVDPDLNRFETWVRLGPDHWDYNRLPIGGDLMLSDPDVRLTASEVFG